MFDYRKGEIGMLLNIDTMKEITNIPHRKSFEAWKKNISEIDYRAIIDELNKRIDDNQEIHTAGWMPGHDWTGTVFYPIYLACKKDKSAAALFFGIIVFIVFMERTEKWSFGRYNLNGMDIVSMTYFRLGKDR